VPAAADRAQTPLRTVVVAGAQESPRVSVAEELLVTNLVSGELPQTASNAIVRSDSNCQPDEQGVSHCLNELEIGSAKVVVRHHHKMSEVSCLTPGETVRVIGAEQYRAS
jgi:hypothetical protein